MGDRDAATNLMRTNMLKGLYKELTKRWFYLVLVQAAILLDQKSLPG